MEEGRQTWLQYGSKLIQIRGERSQAKFAPKLGVHKNTLGHYERGTRELGADTLRSLVYMGWNANWILTGEGPERLDAQSQPVRREVLMMALQLTEEALGNKVLPPAKHAELVTLIYEMLEEGLPEAKVLRFARAAVA